MTPEGKRAALAEARDGPRTLAWLATRAELRRSGAMDRTLGRTGMGGMMAGTIFGSPVAGFVGSMLAEQLFDSAGDFGEGDLSAQPGNEQIGDSRGDYLGGDF